MSTHHHHPILALPFRGFCWGQEEEEKLSAFTAPPRSIPLTEDPSVSSSSSSPSSFSPLKQSYDDTDPLISETRPEEVEVENRHIIIQQRGQQQQVLRYAEIIATMVLLVGVTLHLLPSSYGTIIS